MMIGETPTIRDIDLDLTELIDPQNLLCEEEILAEEVLEEELCPYSLRTCCASCSALLRIFVVTSSDSIRTLHQLLLSDLSFLCIPCSQRNLRNER
ncbi:E7 protein [Bos taurus papillomavirus 21]|uniref:Protein E7 n=1 Tax=Bos taurus papillomavirus 21 TaxID=1887219 RepID=A0A1B2K298_9PAPI|nr:E7 protein [Bos taurus papillomavirus 21]ANZ90265.1 E7 protein [Bos taurus papillomavirus 21]